MSFVALSVICLVGLAGPLLSYPRGLHLPVVFGELAVGLVLGKSGTGYLAASNSTFAFLADVGFALVMFVAGSHVPLRDPHLRPALRLGAGRAVVVGVVAVGLGLGLSAAFDTGHGALYAVVMASSSAALILPIIDSLRLGGTAVLDLLPQVAIADAACIVALPLVIDTRHVTRAALGAAVVVGAGVLAFFFMREVEKRGIRKRIHKVSEDRQFAVELRVYLTILFALAALAKQMHVSIMLAGFVFGLAASAVGEPRRLAKQMFALTEGFLGPIFFVWLGSSMDLGELASHPKLIGLGLALGFGAVLVHLVAVVVGQDVRLALLAAAQLGVPVAAATLGTQTGRLPGGEPSALILGALITIVLSVVGGALAVRAGMVVPAVGKHKESPTEDTDHRGSSGPSSSSA